MQPSYSNRVGTYFPLSVLSLNSSYFLRTFHRIFCPHNRSHYLRHKKCCAYQILDTRPPTLLTIPYSLGVQLPALGLRGVEAARLDINSKPVPINIANDLEKLYREMFSVNEFVTTFTNDVNQQEQEAERLVSRELLAKWVDGCPGFDKHSIFYDEDNANDYIDSKISDENKKEGNTSKNLGPNEENKYHPYLSRKVALDILFHLFLV